MKYTYFIIIVVLVAVIVVLAYKKSRDEKNAENLLTNNTDNTESISTNGGTATSTNTSSTVVVLTGFAKGDAVIVKAGSAMRRLSDPNIIDYQTTLAQKGWTIEKDLFSGSFKSGTTKVTGTWAIISKSVVGFGSTTWIPSFNTGVKIYQVVHISRITKA